MAEAFTDKETEHIAECQDCGAHVCVKDLSNMEKLITEIHDRLTYVDGKTEATIQRLDFLIPSKDKNGAELSFAQRRDMVNNLYHQVADIHAFLSGIGAALNSPMLRGMLPPGFDKILGG